MMKANDVKMNAPEYWNTLWRQHRQSISRSGSGECALLWDGLAAARDYARLQAGDPGGRNTMILRDLVFVPGGRILDIGAGPGNLSLPLAKNAESICAVEPAAGMANVFREEAATQNVENYRLIHKRWENVTLDELGEPFDLVFAAFSLGFLELRQAIEKMNAVCRGRVYLYWFAGESSWQKAKRAVWPWLYGIELPPPPETDILAGMLRALDYAPLIKTYSYSCFTGYDSLAELVERQRMSYNLDTPELEAMFLQAFRPYISRNGARFFVEESADFNSYSWIAVH
jgi:ubiquinone/menaquinone biosynthesis C-methylase UbiE